MKKAAAFLTAIFMFITMMNTGSALGSDFDGTPLIKLVTAQTVEAEVGTETTIRSRVRNVGTVDAENVFIQVSTDMETPFKAEIRQSTRSYGRISVRQEREIVIDITVDKDAAPGTYPMTLSYTYGDIQGTVTETTDIMNVKVIGSEAMPKVSLKDFAMNPEFLRPGRTAVISATYENASNVRARNVRITLEGLSNEGVTVVGGLATRTITEEGTYYSEKISFTVTAVSGVKAGSYPIKFVTTYTDDRDIEHKNENTYYVNVSSGGVSSGGSSVTVTNAKTATGTYGVGENFNISFDLKNAGTGVASSIKVTAKSVEDGAIVPTSQNIQIVRTLAAGASSPVSFTFAATSSAATKNYPIEVTIEYFDGDVNDTAAEKITFSHYFGVNVFNPDKTDDDDDDDSKRNVPKIIISDYNSNPAIVSAGETFDLSMTFFNSHSTKTVSNIKISLTVVDKDEEKGANIFSPVDASNTLYVSSIAPGGSVSRTIKYSAVPDAQPQNYTITVNFEYEDAQGNQFTSTELVGINVSQPPSLETSPIEVPAMGSVGQPVFVGFDMYNIGRVKISNLKVVLDGDFTVEGNKSTWFGNFESGEYVNYYATFFPNSPGQLSGTITIEYDSATGEHYSIPHEFTMEVSEMMDMDPSMEGRPDMLPPEGEQGGGISKWIYIAGGVAVVVAIGAVVTVLVIRKNKKEFEFDE